MVLAQHYRVSAGNVIKSWIRLIATMNRYRFSVRCGWRR
jgi:hypothetical protein